MTREGHIARWDAERGFGFIATAAGERNIFFHVRDFRGGLPAEGLAVRFEQIEVGGKGPRAMAVEVLIAAGARPASADGTRSGNAARIRSGNADGIRSGSADGIRSGNGSAAAGTPRAPARRATGAGPRATAPRPAAAHWAGARAPVARAGRPSAGRSGGPQRPAGGTRQPLWFVAALLLWALLLAAGTLRGLWPVWALGLLAALNLLTWASYAHDKRAARQGAWRTPEKTLHLLALAGGWPAARWAQQRLRHKSGKPAFQGLYGTTVALNLLALAALLWRASTPGGLP